MLQSFGYVGIKTRSLGDWSDYGSNFLGLQRIDRSAKTLAFRMDDRKQRVIVDASESDGANFYGWEVANASALDALAAKLEAAGVPVARGAPGLADERFVKDLIVFHDPAGNRLEAFHGAQVTSEPFKPGRNISGFRTGVLGMGHAVLTAARIDDVLPFYQDLLGFRLSDYITRPFRAYFFHINPRHHSLAFIESTQNGVHHLMMEHNFLDDVGQAYDLATAKPELIGVTFGRHVNDHMTSFYSNSPSGFMVELGWGGRSIDMESWVGHECHEGPSLWGHDRNWLTPEKRIEARELRMQIATEGRREPVHVMEGNHTLATGELAPGTCAWWDAATAPRNSSRKTS
jgi:2,3-dihydroxybiphenyl 1,2-dioxygenase